MSTEDHDISAFEEKTPTVSPGTYSPVTVYVKDSLGALFLGIFATIFLIKWMSAETRTRALIDQQEKTNGNHSFDTR
jgi:hypothetical protein